jgi:tetratricopeptide (TPR) repeat protein
MQEEISNKKALCEIDVIIDGSNPDVKLLIFDNRLVFKTTSNLIEVFYCSITSVIFVDSIMENEAHIYLAWSDQRLTFAIQGNTKNSIYVDLTEKITTLITALRDKTAPIEKIINLFHELTPPKLKIRRIKKTVNIILLGLFVIIIGVFFSVQLNSFWLFPIVCLAGVILLMVFAARQSFIVQPAYKIIQQGEIRMVKGDIDGAIHEFFKGLEIFPNNLTINLNIAKCYYRKKNWANARYYCEKVLLSTPNHKEAKKLLDEALCRCDGHLNKRILGGNVNKLIGEHPPCGE